MPEFRVRPIRRADREQWAPLWRAYLAFYRAVETSEVTKATWGRIFDPLEPVHAVVAERDGGDLIGFSHYLSSAARGSSTRSATSRISMSAKTRGAAASAGL